MANVKKNRTVNKANIVDINNIFGVLLIFMNHYS